MARWTRSERRTSLVCLFLFVGHTNMKNMGVSIEFVFVDSPLMYFVESSREPHGFETSRLMPVWSFLSRVMWVLVFRGINTEERLFGQCFSRFLDKKGQRLITDDTFVRGLVSALWLTFTDGLHRLPLKMDAGRVVLFIQEKRMIRSAHISQICSFVWVRFGVFHASRRILQSKRLFLPKVCPFSPFPVFVTPANRRSEHPLEIEIEAPPCSLKIKPNHHPSV